MSIIGTQVGETFIERMKQVVSRHTKDDVLRQLVEFDEPTMLMNIPNNVNTSPETLHLLVTKWRDDDINWNVVNSKKNLKKETLKELFLQGDQHVRSQIATRKNVSKKLLTELFKLQDSKINEGLVRNPKLSTEFLENIFDQLSGKEEEQFSSRIYQTSILILKHKNVTLKIVEKIANTSDDEFVRREAVVILLKKGYHSDWPVEWVCSHYNIALRSSLPAELVQP